MGNCIYCGEKAGIFRNKHAECQDKYQKGSESIVKIIHDAYLKNDFEMVKKSIDEIAIDSSINDKKRKSL